MISHTDFRKRYESQVAFFREVEHVDRLRSYVP